MAEENNNNTSNIGKEMDTLVAMLDSLDSLDSMSGMALTENGGLAFASSVPERTIIKIRNVSKSPASPPQPHRVASQVKEGKEKGDNVEEKEEEEEFLMVEQCPEEVDMEEDASERTWNEAVLDACTAAMSGFVRNVSPEKITQLTRFIFQCGEAAASDHALDLEAREMARVDAATAAFVMWAQTRDIRGNCGKGERDIATIMLVRCLARRCPVTALKMIPLIPEYGSWADIRRLVEEIDASAPELEEFRGALLEHLADQLMKDKLLLQKIKAGEEIPHGAKVSLAAKWTPREKQHKAIATQIAHMRPFGGDGDGEENPDKNNVMRAYRKLHAELSQHLDVPEIKMCAGEWKEIKPAGVPAACLNKKRRAFMNMMPERTKDGRPHPNKGDVRRPDDPDRKECREIWDVHLEACKKGKGSVHGRNLQIQQLTAKYMKFRSSGIKEDDVIEAQWTDMHQRMADEIKTANADGNLSGAAASNYVGLVDVSGSMSGIPMEVSVGLGILLAVLSPPPFHRRVISFTSTPTWHNLGESTRLVDLVNQILRTPWGMSTNIEKALKMVVDTCHKAGIKQPPALIVFTDMQFDAARKPEQSNHYSYVGFAGRCRPTPPRQQAVPWETAYENLEAYCKSYGIDVPQLIFWNLRGDTDNVPVKSDQKGTILVSGFSPNLLKLFLSGKLEAEAGKSPDPNAATRVIMESEEYEAVRAIVKETSGM